MRLPSFAALLLCAGTSGCVGSYFFTRDGGTAEPDGGDIAALGDTADTLDVHVTDVLDVVDAGAEAGPLMGMDVPDVGVAVTDVADANCEAGSHACAAGCASNGSTDSCGTSCIACPVPANGSATCDGNTCGISCMTGYVVSGSYCVGSPRPIAPLSTSTVSSWRPTFHWVLSPGSTGAHVRVCSDRACGTVAAEFDATGTSGSPPTDLPPGVVFWTLQSLVSGARVGPVGPTWLLHIPRVSTHVDAWWGDTPDVDGDGFADVIVGDGGSANVFRGGSTGVASTFFSVPAMPAEILSLGAAGDVNGDGFSDVVMAGRWVSGDAAYSVTVYFGSSGGLVRSSPFEYLCNASEVGSVGDVNGDGFGDIVATGVGLDRGYVNYLFLGSASGPASTPILLTLPPNVRTMTSAGDVNGDTYGDVLFAEPGGAGSYLFLGGPTGLASAPSATFDSMSALAQVADVNGDGIADAVFGDPGDGYVNVFQGNGSAFEATPSTRFGTGVYGFATVVATLDANGDGCSDIVVDYNVYMGSSTGVMTASVNLTAFSTFGSGFGSAESGTDVNNDGYADLIVGADSLFPNGTAYVFFGSAEGLISTDPAALFGPTGGADTLFGEWVALASPLRSLSRHPWRI